MTEKLVFGGSACGKLYCILIFAVNSFGRIQTPGAHLLDAGVNLSKFRAYLQPRNERQMRHLQEASYSVGSLS
jgi:hypothetical protein